MSSSATSNEDSWVGFAEKTWQVHKFGGTSVANADCYRSVAQIVEEQLGVDSVVEKNIHLGVVVSAMGGKPKTTDLLLESVLAAAARDQHKVEELLSLILQKHSTCLEDLFSNHPQDKNRLLGVLNQDLEDIQDILKTVALMKWQATRISELVSGYGELWSAQILSTLLQHRASARNNKLVQGAGDTSLQESTGILHEFVYIDARRIITIDEGAIQNGAVVWDMSKEKLQEVYDFEWSKMKDQENTRLHFCITGYVASNTEGVATTLQRDGSDYSAAIMGRLLQSTSITIWTDVDGVLSADPRRVPDAHAVPEVSYNEAMELAYFGAKVIHPKTMQPAISSSPQIPIFIRNTFHSQFRGSRIYTTSTTNTEPDKCVCGFSSIDGMALINVEGSGLIGVHGVAKRLFGTLESCGVNVVLISQASSEHSITFATVESHARIAKDAICEEFEKELKQNHITDIDVKMSCSIIAAVGDGMHEVSGVSGRFFSALGDAKINVLAISQGCSERNISAVILASQSTRALRALHAAFRLSHSTVRVGVVGLNELGESLVLLFEAQRKAIRSAFEIDLQICSVALDSHDTDVLSLKSEVGEESITMASIVVAQNGDAPQSVTFDGPEPVEVSKTHCVDLGNFLESFLREDSAHHVVFDCTNDPKVSQHHARWLSNGVHVITANNTGLSGPIEQRKAIDAAESANGRLSAKYLREVTVGGGLPVLSTLRTLLSSGDKIRRVDGIFSVSMSYIMYRISPPPESSRSGTFDQAVTGGSFKGDITLPEGASLATPCSFNQAVKEALSLGLMEKEVEHDLGNEYSARVMMILAKELGLDSNLSMEQIRDRSDQLTAGGIEAELAGRVASAVEKGCVLRHIASIDVATESISIRIVEVPNNHVFAVNPPSSECVRFFTKRYQPYPLVIQGPAAGDDCTSSALLAEVLSLMSSKIGPKAGVLTRRGSSAQLA